jgi:hypothetical protein
MPNPYHDAEGKFCSGPEMKAAYEALATQPVPDLEGYFKLRTEYEAIKANMAPFETPQRTNITATAGTSLRKKRAKTPLELTRASKLKAPDLNNRYLLSYSDSGLDMESDGYGTPPGEEPEEYGRNDVYYNPQVVGTPNVKHILAGTFGIEERDVPTDLYNYAVNNLEMDKIEAYQPDIIHGYYGEEGGVGFSDYVKTGLMSWYQQQPGLTDSAGIRDYVRSKGTNPDGNSAVDSVKAQLSEEYKGKLPKAVKEANKVYTKKFTPKQITITDASRFDRTKPIGVEQKNSVAKDIAGVVVKSEDGKYMLVDGYARLKSHKNTEPRKSREYIVLERSNYSRLTDRRNRWDTTPEGIA